MNSQILDSKHAEEVMVTVTPKADRLLAEHFKDK